MVSLKVLSGKQVGYFPEAHEVGTGLLLDVLERAAGGGIDDLLGPVDPQKRVDGDEHVFGINGALLLPFRLQDLYAIGSSSTRVGETTFSEPLADALRTKLRRLISNEPRLGSLPLYCGAGASEFGRRHVLRS